MGPLSAVVFLRYTAYKNFRPRPYCDGYRLHSKSIDSLLLERLSDLTLLLQNFNKQYAFED
jgi:hypothetical protein